MDLQKYHSGAALLKNFFVDYRGGASSCPGTKYILQGFKSGTRIRLIPFQASFSVNYVLEFGDFYIRFYNNGAPVLETGLNITGVTQANPAVVTVANSYNVGDWVFISGVSGMTQLNGNYYQVSAASAATITLADLNGVAINSTGYGAWTAGGTTARVYTLVSPYAAADLGLLKYAMNVNTMVVTHSSYQPYALTLVSAANWTLLPITFGSTVSIPTNFTANTTGTGSLHVAYVVTANDKNNQESAPSAVAATTVNPAAATLVTVTLGWTAVPEAVSYNVYRSATNSSIAPPAGAAYGFLQFTTGTSLVDLFSAGVPQLANDFSETPPIAQNPFASGSAIASFSVTSGGTYATVPTVIVVCG